MGALLPVHYPPVTREEGVLRRQYRVSYKNSEIVMPAKLKNGPDLSTPASRRRLTPKGGSAPYWRFISEGRYLGYRKQRGNPEIRKWCARVFIEARRDAGKAPYLKTTLGVADDKVPADGETVLNYAQALKGAMAWCDEQERRSLGLAPRPLGPYTVGHAVEDYLGWYKEHRRGYDNFARPYLRAHVLSAPLARRQVEHLTAEEIKRWHIQLARTPPRTRTKRGKPQGYGEVMDDEARRKRKVTANKVLTLLKAALSMAFRDGKVSSDLAWRRVKRFEGVDAPRIRFLDFEEVGRLLRSCEADFRDLVRAALLTGCRYGELGGMRVTDFVPEAGEAGAVHVRTGKDRRSKPRDIFLNEEGYRFFDSLVAGRKGMEPMFLRQDGGTWERSQQVRRMREACIQSSIDPPVTFHLLRHTYASHYLMNGGSLEALAKQLGHADTRMTILHYGHLADRWRAEEAARHAPSFGIAREGNVTRLRRRSRSPRGGSVHLESR